RGHRRGGARRAAVAALHHPVGVRPRRAVRGRGGGRQGRDRRRRHARPASRAAFVKVEAVTFDFWNTLFRSDTAATAQQRRDAFAAVFAARDVAVSLEVVDSVLDHLLEQHYRAWHDNRQFTAAHAIDEALKLLG